MRVKRLIGEEGQAAVLITLLLMFAFIVLAALAIDGGNLYVVRRDLQNMADAACLAGATELALGGDEAGAIVSARDYVIRNGGQFFSEWTGPDDNLGSGSGLIYGIEVAGADVRVALQEEVPTYFTMIFNRSGATVGAGSHCNRSAGWGPLLPIAVRRYEYNADDETMQLDLLSNKSADPRPGDLPCETAGTCHYPQTSIGVPLPSRYGEMLFYGLRDEYKPTTGTVDSPQTGNIDCDLPPGDDNYDGVCILGVHASTNDGTENYTGWVALDIRNIVGPGSPAYPSSPAYFNEADGQAATNKALASEWFCERGWRGEVLPVLGDQLAFLPGVSADFAPKGMLACDPPWQVGDQFIGVVYSGYVWEIPDLEVSVEPAYGEIEGVSPGTTQAITYTVTLKKPPESPDWPGVANFLLNYLFTAQGAITPTAQFEPSATVILESWQSEASVDMVVSVTDPITPANYVSGLMVEVVETGLGLKRWSSTNFAYRGEPSFDEDFTLYAHALEFNATQGAKVPVMLPTMAFGGFKEKKTPVHATLWSADPWDSVFTPACQDQTIDIPNSNDTFDLRVQADASIGAHTVTLEVNPDTAGVPSRSVDIVVHVKAPSGGDPTRFVVLEGFADFEIAYIDQNDVAAYAIGPIVSEITSTELYGMRPSLMPW